MIKELSKYLVVMCPHCGKLQITEARKSLTCRNESCGKQTQIRKGAGWGVRMFFMYDNANEARMALNQLTEEQARGELPPLKRSN